MAIYRFRVTFEDYEEVYREIDMPAKGTFLELHEQIHNSTGYPVACSSSFYVSNDQWKKGTEIAFLPSERKQQNNVLLMENIRLSKFIDDPHQKFYYIYNFDRPYEFHVELVRILKEEEGKQYPLISKTIGQAPKIAQFGTQLPSAGDEDDDLFDDYADELEDSEEYGVDQEDELGLFDDSEAAGGEASDSDY